MADLSVETTDIPGLLVIRMPVHGDARGWFKENWQRQKMTALGLPDFGPVQNNMSFNAHRGATRGIHTEPWDKMVSVGTGRVYAAWVDMREGDTFGTTVSLELDPEVAVFVPRGVGNSYQALEDNTLYSYLVNDHWRPGIAYPALHLGDASAAIPWPIPLDEAEISEKDTKNPSLEDVTPLPARRPVVLGAGGQLGQALLAALPDAVGLTRADLDLADAEAVAAFPWRDHDVVINAAAWTAVDDAETPGGRPGAWLANASAPATLAALSRKHGFTLVHVSSDYVFDGSQETHTEAEPLSPLGVYGQSKAAGDLAVAGAPRHYLIRTSWVIGEGKNFVRTMQSLAERGISPGVVADQHGRLTFTSDLADAIRHLVSTRAPFGTYNVTSDGPIVTWADIAKRVFELSGRSADDVAEVSTAEYGQGKNLAPRPVHSALSLEKIKATGYLPRNMDDALVAYCRS
ncbi:sugar nucleotide-binding protein [Nocardioides bruguierae]|uniref:sugar nucleotide-binding protein n=1 Tax=Nocardioides bruguierae TaxID=2945102 RepID=UPI00202196C3|nr:bifunctional dTDP-4-dehydrorhamnose 3,5-epimerase family protein/NAD(P)-dependent oxidoreductase [Nocardioides bruguierae]MCL8026266.1 bifunctional dTDP-4-dehydrorhamnose 3,5-epimerase family protein/NAD(P)-dependent oxidoreductase [Nocardioides bruguierae]